MVCKDKIDDFLDLLLQNYLFIFDPIFCKFFFGDKDYQLFLIYKYVKQR